jgi:IPT/TIG domain
MAVDAAGNTATASVSLNIDQTPPVITASQAPPPDANGWNTSAVVVSFAATEALSGLAPESVTTPLTLSGDGLNLSATGQATDLAGNVGSVSRAGINIDRQPPTITVALSPAPNATGWHTMPVTAHFTCSDAVSGVASCTPDQLMASDGADQQVSGGAVDLAGNSQTVLSGIFQMDLTAPTISVSLSPQPNADGWNNGTVTAHFTCSDAGSGIVACPPDEAIVVEGANQTISGTVVDHAGNSASVPSGLVNLDRTPPSITVALSPSATNGVYTGPVTAHFTCTDSLSDVVSCSPDQVVTAGANQMVTGTVTDRAGNTASVTSAPFTLTASGPMITLVAPTTAAAGTPIRITGTGFGASQGGGAVWLGDDYGAVISWSDTEVVATVVSGSESGSADVLQDDVWSNSVEFTVIASPIITPTIFTIAPSVAVAGTPITITGTGFGAILGNGAVWLGSTYGIVVSWSDTQVIATVATGSTSGAADIWQSHVWSNAISLTIITPKISTVAPTSALPGSPITITGTGFGANQGSGHVWLGSTYGLVVSWSDTQIVATIAADAQPGTARVLQGGVWSNSVTFTVIVPPSITSVSPVGGAGGTAVTIVGTNFGTPQGTGSVMLGTINGSVASWSNTKIVAIVAPNSRSGVVRISQGGISSNSSNFAVTTPVIATVSPTSAAVGTHVTITGTGFGPAQGKGTAQLGSARGLVVSWSDSQVIAAVAPGSTSGTAQIIQGVPSNSVSFTVVVPTITGIFPASGTAGTRVALTGAGFGSEQGNATVLLGTLNGAAISWSDTQVIAEVAMGSQSGSAQIVEGASGSNALSFTVVTPTLEAVAPSRGTAGTEVTVTGSGFGAAQGVGNIWLGNMYGSVVSWSDTHIVATVAQGSASGTARILQNGVWSSSVPFDTGILHVASVSPSSGSAGTQVTFTGSGFGPTQSVGTVRLGSTNGLVVSWSDTEVVAAVASDSVTGVARIQQDGISSAATRFVVPTVGDGNAVILVPQVISMLVGDTRGIQSLDVNGTAVPALIWISSDATIASLSTDDPPLITALAPGQVTISAGDASADLTVYAGTALPLGTVIWSAPGDGFGGATILPAVPSATGMADVFAVQESGSIQAITSDGTVAWTAQNVGVSNNNVLPDFQGGVVVVHPTSVRTYDGLTGQPNPEYTYSHPYSSGQSPHGVPVLVHTDGTIFTVDGDSVVGIDPATGTAKFSVRLNHTTSSSSVDCNGTNSRTQDFAPRAQPLLIAGDGYAYFGYSYSTGITTSQCRNDTSAGYKTGSYSKIDTIQIEHRAQVLRVATDGTATEITVGYWPFDRTATTYAAPNPNQGYPLFDFVTKTITSGELPITALRWGAITNGDQGILATLGTYLPGSCDYQLSDPFAYPPTFAGCTFRPYAYPINTVTLSTISAGALASQVTVPSGQLLSIQPVLQGENGTFYGGAQFGASASQQFVSAFDASGTVKWSVPGYSPLMLTADGNLIAKSADGLTTATFDAKGAATGQLADVTTQSWTRHTYRTDSAERLAVEPVELLATFSPVAGANDSRNTTAIPPPTSEMGQGPASAPFPPCTSIDVQGNVGRISVQQPWSGRVVWGVTLDSPIVGALFVHEAFKYEGAKRRTTNWSKPYIYAGVGGTTHGSRGRWLEAPKPTVPLQVGSEYTISAYAFYPPMRATGTLTCIVQ